MDAYSDFQSPQENEMNSKSHTLSPENSPLTLIDDMQGNEGEDINDVLDDVIVKINRITDHLRNSGENEAANHFTRELTDVFRNLYNIIAPWNIEKCLMKPTLAFRRTTHHDTLNQSIDSPTTNTWASVAAIEPIADKNGIIKFRPSDALKQSVENTREQETNQILNDGRVVWVRPWSEARPLSEISKEMIELGAIYSIAYAPEEQAVCIIFQHAHCAVQFIQYCATYVHRNGTSPFGDNHNVTPGLPYPFDEGLRRMDAPHNARRRLTFARSQLFSNGMTEARFRRDVEDIVGKTNVELLWLFNTGNATVVFSAVPLARMVRQKFLDYARIKNHPYAGIMVNYSHDPCEKKINLISQIPGHANFIGSNGKDSFLGRARQNRSHTLSTDHSCGRMSHTSSDYQHPTKRRNTLSKGTIDEDGWQTVKKRR